MQHENYWLRRALCGLMLLGMLCTTAEAQYSKRDSVYLDQLDYAIYLAKYAHAGSNYSFLAAGHWYGAHENSRSQHPASSLYAAIDNINRLAPDEIFALGDVVRDASDSTQVAAYLNLPFHSHNYLIPGNHDLLPDGSIPLQMDHRVPFQQFKGDRFLLLNTESLRFGGGKAMLAQIADSNVAVPRGRNLMVFSHRLLWALAEPGFSAMDDFANEPFAPLVNADTVQMIYKAILKAAEGGHLHWFSGDIGASWSETVFYGCSTDSLRHFYAAGLGDCKEDAFWRVVVDSLGNVETSVMPLVGSAEEHEKAYYDLDHWRERMQAKREAERIGLLQRVGRLFCSPKFWIGLGLGSLLTLMIMYLLKKLRAAKPS